jgi:N-acetyl-gamma-glutamyl-phosphate reductase
VSRTPEPLGATRSAPERRTSPTRGDIDNGTNGKPVETILVGVVGHGGYAGEELVAYLQRHEGVAPLLLDLPRQEPRHQPTGAASGPSKAILQARQALAQSLLPAAMARSTVEEALEGTPLDAVFLATPVGVSLKLAPRFLSAGTRVIDLSGAFRLSTAAAFEAWYGIPHTCPELLQAAIYGLPEVNRLRLATARLVANPGCLATAASLALSPLQHAGVIDARSLVVCDAKTGVSGAGKESRAATSFCSISENFSLYGSMAHRHIPEILDACRLEQERFLFSAQVLPVRRGVLVTMYFQLDRGTGTGDVETALAGRYAAEPFVDVVPGGSFPNLTSVVHTNQCRLGYEVVEPGRRALVVSALDNLGKGAAGQAVQNFNAMFGFAETTGLVSS